MRLRKGQILLGGLYEVRKNGIRLPTVCSGVGVDKSRAGSCYDSKGEMEASKRA